jgi:alkylhydroperoxidase family enzyme
MSPDDLEPMRHAGLDDPAIHDVCAVAAYFAYINRIADGLGVDLEPGMTPAPPWES